MSLLPEWRAGSSGLTGWPTDVGLILNDQMCVLSFKALHLSVPLHAFVFRKERERGCWTEKDRE